MAGFRDRQENKHGKARCTVADELLPRKKIGATTSAIAPRSTPA
jgi:hypothetical protein